MFRLLFTSLLLVGMFFGYSNFTNIEQAYYDATDTVIDSSKSGSSATQLKIGQKIDKFVEPAREAYEGAVDQRDASIRSNLD